MVDDDDETSKDKEIDKLTALISLSRSRKSTNPPTTTFELHQIPVVHIRIILLGFTKILELKRRDSIEYASQMELECAKVREMKNKLSAHQDTISILKQQKDAQIKLYKTREDKEIKKFIDLESKVKVLDNIVYKTGQSVQTMNMLNNKCRMSFAKPEFLKKAKQANPRLYDIGCYNDNIALMLFPESDEVICLEKESQSKLSDLVRPFDYAKLNSLYDLFVPQREKSSEQRFFSERSRISYINVQNKKKKEAFQKQTTFLEKRMDESIPMNKNCQSSLEIVNIQMSINTSITGVELCKQKIANRTYYGHIDPFIQNTIEQNFCPVISKINVGLHLFLKRLNEEMVVDLRYFNSLELEVDSLTSQLKTQKTQFVNEIDRLSREYYYFDHMNAILGMYTELDEVTNLQCDYLELLQKYECLETELSKSKMMSKSFESVQKHAINLELELQQCKEKIKNDMSFKVNKSKDFCKEREQYFEIQDLKAQLQDKCIVINELKKLIEKLKGKSVDTNNVSNNFSKPVTAQTLPKNKKPCLKNTNVLAPGMYKLHTDHTQARTSKLPQDYKKTNKRVSFSTGVIPTTSVSRPQLKSNLLGDRVMHNHSQGKKLEVEEHHRNVKLSKNKMSKAQRANPRLYAIGCYNDNLALMLTPDSEEVIRLEKESRSKLNDLIRPFDYDKLNSLCLNEEMVADLRYFNSLESEVDSLRSQLETQKTYFLNEIDRLSREYYYVDHMNAVLGVYTELDEVTNLQCDYLELLEKCKGLETELSKSQMMSKKLLEKCEGLETELSNSQMMSKSFESVQKHAINLELELQQCKENIKNDMFFKVNKSKYFCKEREQYFEIQDLKAQLQDKGIVISELKKLIEKLKGKFVDTKFEKSAVIRQPNAFKSQRPLVLGKPTTFSNSFVRKDFSKSTSVTQTHVSNDFSKPVIAQTLPTNKKSILKNTIVLAPGMYKLHTEHTQTRTSQLPQDSRKTNKRVSFSTGVKEYQEKDKIKSKPDKNGKRSEAGKSQNNTEDKAECKKLKKELEEARFSNTFLRMQNERVKRDLYWTRVRPHEFYQEM
nr:hypothetical protein [Tanacetum cinerariifolium]